MTSHIWRITHWNNLSPHRNPHPRITYIYVDIWIGFSKVFTKITHLKIETLKSLIQSPTYKTLQQQSLHWNPTPTQESLMERIQQNPYWNLQTCNLKLRHWSPISSPTHKKHCNSKILHKILEITTKTWVKDQTTESPTHIVSLCKKTFLLSRPYETHYIFPCKKINPLAKAYLPLFFRPQTFALTVNVMHYMVSADTAPR